MCRVSIERNQLVAHTHSSPTQLYRTAMVQACNSYTMLASCVACSNLNRPQLIAGIQIAAMHASVQTVSGLYVPDLDEGGYASDFIKL